VTITEGLQISYPAAEVSGERKVDAGSPLQLIWAQGLSTELLATFEAEAPGISPLFKTLSSLKILEAELMLHIEDHEKMRTGRHVMEMNYMR
jgi:hypothetical protein